MKIRVILLPLTITITITLILISFLITPTLMCGQVYGVVIDKKPLHHSNYCSYEYMLNGKWCESCT